MGTTAYYIVGVNSDPFIWLYCVKMRLKIMIIHRVHITSYSYLDIYNWGFSLKIVFVNIIMVKKQQFKHK